MKTKTTKTTTTGTASYDKCPCCNGGVFEPVTECTVRRCLDCGAIFGDTYLGDSYTYVLPYMELPEIAQRVHIASDLFHNPEVGTALYFDFTCVGSEGLTRRHGWYNDVTRRVIQVG